MGPKRGLIMPRKYGAKIKRVVVFLFFYIIVKGFWGVLIIPKWLILIPGHIAILFGTFLKRPKMGPNIDPRPPYLLLK